RRPVRVAPDPEVPVADPLEGAVVDREAGREARIALEVHARAPGGLDGRARTGGSLGDGADRVLRRDARGDEDRREARSVPTPAAAKAAEGVAARSRLDR